MNPEALWRQDRLAEGLDALARRCGLAQAHAGALGVLSAAAAPELGSPALHAWAEWAGEQLGLEVESVDTPLPELEALLRRAAPAVLRVPHQGAWHFVLLTAARGGSLRLLGPDLREHRCPLQALRDAICHPLETPLHPQLDSLLDLAAVPPRQRAQARRTLLRERLAAQRLGGIWLLRPSPRLGFGMQLKQARLPQRLGWMLGLMALVYALEIAGWKLMGSAVLEGRLDLGWLSAWLLLLLSMVPLRLVGGWLDASFALEAGRLLKQRLLTGALRMKLDAVKHQGAGQLLGRVMEAQALESLALNGGLSGLVALLELGFAAWILSLGAAPTLHPVLLLAWLGVTAAAGFIYLRRLRHWTTQRMDMTHALVEGMVGHRTRLAQQSAKRRDAEDDAALQTYLQSSQAMDRAMLPVAAGVPGGWVLLALLGLGPAWVAGGASAAALAISVGGMLFAHRAFGGIGAALTSLARAGIAWQQVAPMFKAAVESLEPSAPLPPGALGTAERLVDAQQLHFAHGGTPVLRGLDLVVQRGERLLLQGPSGGGKSTLAALLSGLRQPDSGLLLLNGLDRPTLGEGWQRLASQAPQFHENHVLSGTLGFNLLMGHQWPASDEDLARAQALCEELGLGDLIQRMPAGMMQRVGETGWQLSHGERSRIFLARALLQGAPLTILDESFAALDPATLQQCLRTALRRAPTLMVIAHP